MGKTRKIKYTKTTPIIRSKFNPKLAKQRITKPTTTITRQNDVWDSFAPIKHLKSFNLILDMFEKDCEYYQLTINKRNISTSHLETDHKIIGIFLKISYEILQLLHADLKIQLNFTYTDFYRKVASDNQLTTVQFGTNFIGLQSNVTKPLPTDGNTLNIIMNDDKIYHAFDHVSVIFIKYLTNYHPTHK